MKDKDLVEEINELRQLDTLALIERYQQLWGKAPRIKNRQTLWRRCAWRLQEIRLGGLSKVAKNKLEELINQLDLPIGKGRRTVTGKLRQSPDPTRPPAGSVISRVWHGKQIVVRVVENGYEYENVVFSSLSAIAKKITSCHWSGPLFFNLRERKNR